MPNKSHRCTTEETLKFEGDESYSVNDALMELIANGDPALGSSIRIDNPSQPRQDPTEGLATSKRRTANLANRINLNVDEARQLGEAIGKNTSLKEISFLDMSLEPDVLAALTEGLVKNQTLETISFNGCHLSPTSVKQLVKILTMMPLKTLDLMRNEIDDFGAACIANALGGYSTLTTLHLDTNSVHDSTAELLFKADVDKRITYWNTSRESTEKQSLTPKEKEILHVSCYVTPILKKEASRLQSKVRGAGSKSNNAKRSDDGYQSHDTK